MFSVREASALPVGGKQEISDTRQSSNPRAGQSTIKGHSESDLHPLTEKHDKNHHPEPKEEPHHNPSRANPGILFEQLEARDKDTRHNFRPTTLAQCNTPLTLEAEGELVAIDTQIQLYATNGQLRHPWVSPVLGFLGGLPPLYICCGSNEVLRDEITYMWVRCSGCPLMAAQCTQGCKSSCSSHQR